MAKYDFVGDEDLQYAYLVMCKAKIGKEIFLLVADRSELTLFLRTSTAEGIYGFFYSYDCTINLKKT